MESNHNIYQEESINSSDEEQENIDLGIGRSYECVFCKRGFNTAQALGGHMNIHRKDRARNKPANNSSKQEEMINYSGPRLYQQINIPENHRFPSHDHHHQQQQQQQSHLNNYATYFPGSSSSATRPLYNNYNHDDGSDSDHQQPSDPMVPGDWRMSLSLEFTPSMIMEDSERNRSQVMNQKEDLDLELRLGYD